MGRHPSRAAALFASLALAAATASLAQAQPADERLQRFIAQTREAAAAAEPAEHRARRQQQRLQLLQSGEAALSRGKVAAAQHAFERAALLEHAADTEMAMVRALMQAGDYRRAVSFSAHTAGAHRQVASGAVLYAWLLASGGQNAAAQRLLDTAAQEFQGDPLVLQARQLLVPGAPPGPALQATPLRLAPYSTGPQPTAPAKVVASATLVDGGRHALVPLAAVAQTQSLWVRNGLGQTARAQTVRRHPALGVALLRLQPALPGTLAPAARDPFPGSIAYAVEFSPGPNAAAWPRLHSGFHGMVGADSTRPLGIALPPGPRGGPVLDAAGQLAGIALPGSAQSAGQVVMGTQLRQAFGPLWGPPSAAPAGPAAALDGVYENALRSTLQLIAAR